MNKTMTAMAMGDSRDTSAVKQVAHEMSLAILAASIPATRACEKQPPLGGPSSKAHHALGRGAMPQLPLGVDWIRW